MRALSAASANLVLVCLVVCQNCHLSSAILPPFAVAAVEAMWAKRTTSTPPPPTTKTTAAKIMVTPPAMHRKETKIPQIMLREVLPDVVDTDSGGTGQQQKMVETFMEGKMMLSNSMSRDRDGSEAPIEGVMGVGGLGGLYPA